MRKGIALATVFTAIAVAIVMVGSAFAFFGNVPDTQTISIGAYDEFSISLGEGEEQGFLSPQTAASDNSGGALGENYVSVTVPYTVADMEGVTAITLEVYDVYSWTADGAPLAEDIAAYVNANLQCRIYAQGAQAPAWGTTTYALPSVAPGAEGSVIMDVKLALTDEETPSELTGAVLTVRIGVEKTVAGA